MPSRRHKYGNASQVTTHVDSYADGGKVKKKAKKKRKPTPGMLGTGAAARTGTTLRDKRKQQMDDLGLADGGRVRKQMKPPEKGGTPKKIGADMNDPGGPHTPGAKKKKKEAAAKKRAKAAAKI